MRWYIKIGDDMSRDHKIKFPFYGEISYDYKADDLIFYSKLYECEDRYVSMNVPLLAELNQMTVLRPFIDPRGKESILTAP
jgi:hypothetical protein